jgi:hypothetical protein
VHFYLHFLQQSEKSISVLEEVFEIGSYYVARLALNSPSTCLSLLSAEITDMHHHA